MNITTFILPEILKRGLVVIILASLISCDGSVGSSSSGVTIVSEGGISGTGISVGRISAFSSVILNGTKLDITNQTQIFVDEQPSTVSDLKVGYVVRADADFDESTALRIDYVETVRGSLEAVPLFNPDTFTGSFNLLGQSVVTNSATILDGLAALSTLNVGDVLDVSGIRDANGAIIARYISLKTPPVTEYRVLGTVANSTLTTFEIGALTVDYSGADIGELGSIGVENGREIRVKGAASDFDDSTSTLLASKITPSTLMITLMTGDSLELEGAITDFQSISSFEVNGITVDAGSAAIENGSVTNLQLNVLIEVEGIVDDSNILVASKVKIIPLSNIRLESTIETVDTVNSSIAVHGKVFELDENTQLEDDSSAGISEFSLDDLSAGDWVEIRAYKLDNRLILTRLERDDLESELDVRIQAPVDENGVDQNNKTITILDITVSTDSNTDYEDVNDMPISESTFFSQVRETDLIKVKWKNFTDTSIPVDELSFED